MFGVLSAVGTSGIWVYTIYRAALGRITLGDVALFFQAAEQSRVALEDLFSRGGAFYEHALYARTLFEFLDLVPQEVGGALAPVKNPAPIPRPIRHSIQFDQVSFSYPGTDTEILTNLSFTLHPGQTVALVGTNGAGKTSLVKLLARYYDPTQGAIRIDGVDLRQFEPTAWQREIGVIFQDFIRYELTARENIGFGQMDQLQNQERIQVAADKGGADSFIEQLTNQYETMLGRTFAEGVELSGGQWQKLALSRAFMREAQILILDEPTAALDALAEYEMYERFAELTQARTTLFISHRFSTVRMADHILVLDEGCLVEEGSHDRLMAQGGQYAQMFKVQAERYR
ncbi:MAG: ATP-binding cassette domain-containing protein [Candidatus Latescibacteria bacterium]|nr:ATP-binding cassette domain-containing protein [Candidatus Latescibacterota bacterium]